MTPDQNHRHCAIYFTGIAYCRDDSTDCGRGKCYDLANEGMICVCDFGWKGARCDSQVTPVELMGPASYQSTFDETGKGIGINSRSRSSRLEGTIL